MTTRTRKLRPHPSSRGLTLVEVIAVVVVIGVAVALAVGAAQPRTQKEAHIAKCANNLRLLAAAAHCYADDFEEKFFYDWGREKTLDGKDHGEPKRWWDQERVGRYLSGTELQWYQRGDSVLTPLGVVFAQVPMDAFTNDAGLGGGAFQCPADVGGLTLQGGRPRLTDTDAVVGLRSYNQNFWASGITVTPEIRDHLSKDGERTLSVGQMFDRQVDVPLDRLILMTEMLTDSVVWTRDSRKGKWATRAELGSRESPGRRFSGRDYVMANPGIGPNRWPVHGHPIQLAYTRHGGDIIRAPSRGGINIAYADGHVAWRTHTDLYELETGRSTYRTLWSPVDRTVDRKGDD